MPDWQAYFTPEGGEKQPVSLDIVRVAVPVRRPEPAASLKAKRAPQPQKRLETPTPQVTGDEDGSVLMHAYMMARLEPFLSYQAMYRQLQKHWKELEPALQAAIDNQNPRVIGDLQGRMMAIQHLLASRARGEQTSTAHETNELALAARDAMYSFATTAEAVIDEPMWVLFNDEEEDYRRIAWQAFSALVISPGQHGQRVRMLASLLKAATRAAVLREKRERGEPAVLNTSDLQSLNLEFQQRVLTAIAEALGDAGVSPSFEEWTFDQLEKLAAVDGTRSKHVVGILVGIFLHYRELLREFVTHAGKVGVDLRRLDPEKEAGFLIDDLAGIAYQEEMVDDLSPVYRALKKQYVFPVHESRGGVAQLNESMRSLQPAGGPLGEVVDALNSYAVESFKDARDHVRRIREAVESL